MNKHELYKRLRRGLRIDPLALDEAALKHSDFVHRVSNMRMRTQSRVDHARDMLAQYESELLVQLRKQATKKSRKPTEAQLKSEMMATPKYQEYAEDVRVARQEAGQWQALEKAYEHRLAMLRLLGSLYVNEYFSVTTSDRGVSQIRRGRSDRNKDKVAEGYKQLSRRRYNRDGGDSSEESEEK